MRSGDGLKHRISWYDLDERGCVRGLFSGVHVDVAILIEVGAAGNPSDPGAGCALALGGDRIEARNLPMANALAELTLLKPHVSERKAPGQVLAEFTSLLAGAPQQSRRRAG
jgi:hypothetical protein